MIDAQLRIDELHQHDPRLVVVAQPVATYDPQAERDHRRVMVLQLGSEALVLTPEHVCRRIAAVDRGVAVPVQRALARLSTEYGGLDLSTVSVRRIFEAVLAEVLRP